MFIVPVHRDSRQFSRLFDDTLERFFNASPESPPARSPALDIAETEQAYTVRLEMPGVAKEDVKVEVDGRKVTVRAEVRHSEEKKDGERVVHRERSAASFARAITLPVEVDLAEAGARLEQGVLTLNLPKRSARSAAHITVN